MAVVTYLLGAGASSQALPTYMNFAARFNGLKKILQNGMGMLNEGDRRLLAHIVASIDSIQFEFAFHNTPDTIAKKYFHMGQKCLDSLWELKRILILYFIYEQSLGKNIIASTSLKDEVKNPVDKRYDSFIASILEPEYALIKVQPNIKVLTWNYDLQFEFCFQNYHYVKNLAATQQYIQSVPNIINTGVPEDFTTSNFSILHLNGIAYPQVDFSLNISNGQLHDNATSLVTELLNVYSYMKQSGHEDKDGQLLNFAWERHAKYPSNKDLPEFTLEKAKEIARITDILVVIGYSFPIFNRTIDMSILSEMKQLQKIYVQAPNANILKETMLSAFSDVNDTVAARAIETINGVDYFHLPRELNSPYISV